MLSAVLRVLVDSVVSLLRADLQSGRIGFIVTATQTERFNGLARFAPASFPPLSHREIIRFLMTIQENPPNDIANGNGSNSDTQRLTRRRLLGSAAGMAAVAAASALMPPNVRRVLAEAPPKEGSLRDIKHVVMLMQENRSFDHYFGTLAGVRGFDDPKALTAFQRQIGLLSTGSRESRAATCCRSISTPARTSAQKIPSTSHAWNVQHDAWNGGKMDNWLPAHRKADGAKGALRHGLSHPGRHPVPVRPRRSVHHLRRLPLLGDGADLAESHVLDDRHDRSRGAATAGR